MKNIHLLFATGLLMVTAWLSSCSKDNSSGTGSNALSGTYDFVSMQSSTRSTVSYSDQGSFYEDITDAVWQSKNNKGTVVIDDKNFTSNALSYSIDTTIRAYFYQDQVLQDSLDEPFSIDIPQSSGTSAYKLVTSDSLYFSGGSVLFNGASGSSTGSGATFKWEGDILYLNASIVTDSTEDQGGFTALVHDEATVRIGLKKH